MEKQTANNIFINNIINLKQNFMKYKFLRISLLSALTALFGGTALGATETVTYALQQGEAHVAGETVNVVADNEEVVATLTFGVEGDADFKAPKEDSKITGFWGYTEGNGVNPTVTDGVATAGTVYTIKPKYDGNVEVGVVLNADKKFYVLEDGTALADYDGITVNPKYQGTYKFDVVGGKEYLVYCAGSKLGFYGFNYTYEPTADEEEPEVGEGAATVKMTWVDYDNPDTANGEVETAQAGYNKISNGEVGFVNTGWGCNWITYLQVDASEYPGTITKATLTFEGSGSTDSKRTTGWGVGYNSSAWSADMTYNTADKSITTIGTEQWTSTKSATVFESFTFDITEALKKAEGKVATILVYETAAAGGYLKNPTVTVSYTTAKPYAVTFTETNGVEATVMVDGSDVTEGAELPNGTYEFTATAAGYKDYAGEFTVAGADLVVEFTMEAKAVYSYTVKGVDAEGNDLGTVNKGEGYEGENVTYYYPEFVLDGTTLYKKNNNSTNPYWGATGLLDTDEKEFTVTYGDATIADVVFYKEAEEIEGFTAKTTNNAPIRCSNGTGGIVEGEVLLTNLPVGKYQIFGQVWGTTGLTAGVKAGADGENVWTLASTGSLTGEPSAEFELTEPTDLYVYTEGGNDNHMLDLIYIVRTGDVATGINTVNAKTENSEVYNLQGQKVEKAQKGLYIVNGKKMVVK